MLLLLIFVPLVAAGFNIALALRLDDAGLKGTVTKTVGWGPPFAFVWTFAGSAVVNYLHLPEAVYFGLTLACYAAVLAALLRILSQHSFRGHAIWCILLTLPSIISPILWGTLSF